jgi:hypothetical protein
MKKIIASAVGLMLVGGVAVTAASAVESQFGGYNRTRIFVQDNFDGQDSASYSRSDNRTRLYYTAKFSDDFKFVNKFEFNSVWGDTNGGDIGADGDTFRVKNSYVDFTLGMINTKIGIQGATISRGFIFADDFSGAVVTADFGMVKLPILYAQVQNEDVNSAGTTWVIDQDSVAPGGALVEKATGFTGDSHILSIMPTFKIGDNVTLTPHGTYYNITSEDTDIYYLGLDAEMKFDAVSAWFTGIYNGGQLKDVDVDAFLLAAGVDAGIVHGQAFYASGEEAGGDIDGFIAAPGSSYYWSEIMGLGIFDNKASAGSPDDNITNIAAFNVGVTVKPMDKLKVDFDVWYAMLAEDNLNGDDQLGLEFDAKVTYALMDNLNAEFVFAYLVADDATAVVTAAGQPDNSEDVLEAGVRLSLSF